MSNIRGRFAKEEDDIEAIEDNPIISDNDELIGSDLENGEDIMENMEDDYKYLEELDNYDKKDLDD